MVNMPSFGSTDSMTWESIGKFSKLDAQFKKIIKSSNRNFVFHIIGVFPRWY